MIIPFSPGQALVPSVPAPIPEVSHTAAFNTMGGTYTAPQRVLAGGTVRRPDEPEKKNAEFTGWYASTDPEEPPYEFGSPMSADITLYARWQGGEEVYPVYHAVAFYTHHEDVLADPPCVIQEGGRIPRPYEPYDGQIIPGPDGTGTADWRFAGWYADQELTRLWNFGRDTVGRNVSLFAGWKHPVTGEVGKGPNNGRIPDGHPVIFNTHSSLIPSPNHDIKETGESVARPALLRADVPVSTAELFGGEAREGFRFAGWYEEDSPREWRFEEDPDPTPVNGTLVLQARWEALYFTVDFNSQGGTHIQSERVNNGGFLREPAEPVREGYIFEGWYTHSKVKDSYDGTADAMIPDGNRVRWPLSGISSSMVLHAHWKFDSFIHYNSIDFPDVDNAEIQRFRVSADRWLQQIMDQDVGAIPGYYVVEFPAGMAQNQAQNFQLRSGQYLSLRGDDAMNPGRIIAPALGVNDLKWPTYIVNAGAKLVLRNVSVEGYESNEAPLISVGYYKNGSKKAEGGELVMESGSKISGNKYWGWGSGGNGEWAPYNDGKTVYGGGVQVVSGTFTMNGGLITGNAVHGRSTASIGACGGGVGLYGGTFIMNGGIISYNTVTGSGTAGGANYGGGVGGTGGSTFIMNGGVISNNKATHALTNHIARGGGVGFSGGTVIKNGGAVYGKSLIPYMAVQPANTAERTNHTGTFQGSSFYYSSKAYDDHFFEAYPFPPAP